MFFRLRDVNETAAPFLTASARYPSHLTSYDQSKPTGKAAARVAIIGGTAVANRGKAGWQDGRKAERHQGRKGTKAGMPYCPPALAFFPSAVLPSCLARFSVWSEPRSAHPGACVTSSAAPRRRARWCWSDAH